MSAPTVTFVIALYGEAEVGEAIASALAQEGVRADAIVVDDASPGGVAPAALEAARREPERVRVVRRARNGGPAAARNEALALATGEWIAILDSDDRLLPERTRRLLAAADGADMVIDNPLVERDGLPAAPMFPSERWAALGAIDAAAFARANGLFETRFTLGYTKPMLRRAMLEQHDARYDEALRVGEDYHLVSDVLLRGATLRAAEASGYVYRVRAGSVSRVLTLEHARALLAADRRHRASHPAPDAATGAALDARSASLERAERFLALVDAIKGRRWREAAGLALRHPRAARLLALPIAARLARARAALPRPARRPLRDVPS